MNREIDENITLDKPGMSFSTLSMEHGKILLLWKHDRVYLDLMMFYKIIDGSEGGIFAYEYRQIPKDEGAMHEFPYIWLSGNLSNINVQYEQFWNELEFRKIDESISDINIVVLDYDSAIEDIPVNYTTFDSLLKIQYNESCNIDIPLKCPTKGNVYVICRIKNESGMITIINESKCISLKDACETIPGFKLICGK
jgi:uncharacterized protein involved in tellurium resistance